MATSTRLRALHLQTVSADPKGSKEIERLAQSMKELVHSIHGTVTGPETSHLDSKEFNGLLMDVSNFFNNQKFSTTILPVLRELHKQNPDQWKGLTTIRDGKEVSLTPEAFENITKENQSRELAFLKIFGIQFEAIYRTQRILRNNHSN